MSHTSGWIGRTRAMLLALAVVLGGVLSVPALPVHAAPAYAVSDMNSCATFLKTTGSRGSATKSACTVDDGTLPAGSSVTFDAAYPLRIAVVDDSKKGYTDTNNPPSNDKYATFVNQGTITLTGSAGGVGLIVDPDVGEFSNLGHLVIHGALATGASVTNAGTILVNGELRIERRLTNTGTITVSCTGKLTHKLFFTGNAPIDGCPPTARATLTVAAGLDHTCALIRDRTVVCWGDNAYGQATPPNGLRGVAQLAAGGRHTCALKIDSTVVCWGDNTRRQATPPNGLRGVAQLSAGGYYTCALKVDSTVVCWGDNTRGQATPPNGLRGVMQLAAGVGHTCARMADRTVVCWGDNYDGQATPPRGLYGVIQVAAGGWYTCAVKDDSTVVCWGEGDKYDIPNCAVEVDSTVVCWGGGDKDDRSNPGTFDQGQAMPPPLLRGVIQVAAGYWHACAATVDTGVDCWGDNRRGQTTPQPRPGVVTQLAAGGHHTCALMFDSRVFCWGDNYAGQATPPPELSFLVPRTATPTNDPGTVTTAATGTSQAVATTGTHLAAPGSEDSVDQPAQTGLPAPRAPSSSRRTTEASATASGAWTVLVPLVVTPGAPQR